MNEQATSTALKQAHGLPPLPLMAEFNPLYKPYLVITIGLGMCVTVVLIPVAVLWFCGLGWWWAGHYFRKLECVLDERSVRFRKGILFQVERTIPLENIQDVTFIEGPVLRAFHLASLSFETAGSSAANAHSMSLTGIINAHEFRNAILQVRQVARSLPHATANMTAQAASQIVAQGGVSEATQQQLQMLIDLNEQQLHTLQRIEQTLKAR